MQNKEPVCYPLSESSTSLHSSLATLVYAASLETVIFMLYFTVHKQMLIIHVCFITWKEMYFYSPLKCKSVAPLFHIKSQNSTTFQALMEI